MVNAILPVLQMILAAGNICIIGYGFYKFLGKPHSTLESKVVQLDTELKELRDRVKEGDRHIDVNGDALEAIQRCLVCLLEFEISYCINTGYGNTSALEEAKRELNSYLVKRKG